MVSLFSLNSFSAVVYRSVSFFSVFFLTCSSCSSCLVADCRSGEARNNKPSCSCQITTSAAQRARGLGRLRMYARTEHLPPSPVYAATRLAGLTWTVWGFEHQINTRLFCALHITGVVCGSRWYIVYCRNVRCRFGFAMMVGFEISLD